MSVKTGCLHQLMTNSFSEIRPLQGTRPCFSIKRNLHLLTFLYFENTIKHIYSHQSKKKNKVVFATIVLTLLETEKPDGVNF